MVNAPLILPAAEYSVAEQVWHWLQENGHSEHGEFVQSLDDPIGTVTCSCGSQFVPYAGVAAEAGQAVTG